MKTIDISIIGLSHDEVNKFRNDKVNKLYTFPNLQLAHNHLAINGVNTNVIFIKYDGYFNLTKSFLKLVKSNPVSFPVIVVLLADPKYAESLKWFYYKGLVDDIFDASFQIEDAISRVSTLIELEEPLTFKKVRKSYQVKIPFSKRAFDVVVASLILILLSPLLVIVSIGVVLDSGYPFFYKSKRVGTGYQLFDFYKFRSMRKNAEKELGSLKDQNQYSSNGKKEITECSKCKTFGYPCSPEVFSDGRVICESQHFKEILNKRKGTFIKINNDPRVTKFGRFIRNTSIDELPQLINVLKGDMSIVGNRPLPLYEAELLTTDKWSERFNAPAGITGLWQVEKRGSKTMSEFERKELDNKYARNYSLFNDFKLLLRTIPALLQKESV